MNEIKSLVSKERLSVMRAANQALVCLYWNVDKAIWEKHKQVRLGSKGN